MSVMYGWNCLGGINKYLNCKPSDLTDSPKKEKTFQTQLLVD